MIFFGFYFSNPNSGMSFIFLYLSTPFKALKYMFLGLLIFLIGRLGI